MNSYKLKHGITLFVMLFLSIRNYATQLSYAHQCHKSFFAILCLLLCLEGLLIIIKSLYFFLLYFLFTKIFLKSEKDNIKNINRKNTHLAFSL